MFCHIEQDNALLPYDERFNAFYYGVFLPRQGPSMTIEIRPATPSDAPQILAFITELADFEKARHEVIASVADIERSLFGEGATAHGLICLRDGLPIGFARCPELPPVLCA